MPWSPKHRWLSRLCGLGLLFKVEVDDVLGLMSSQGGPQDR